MTDQLGTPREGIMSIAASLLSVVKPRYIEPIGERTKLQKVMLTSFMTLRTRAPDKLLVSVSSPSSNVKPAHNQELCSQLTMRLSISPVCCKQRIERIEW
jgi:hypothetical protein